MKGKKAGKKAEKGREEGEELFAQLTRLLIQNSCEHDLLRATEDKAYRQLLYEEYGLLKGDA